MYDTEDAGFGTAIVMYIKLLTKWVHIDKFQFPHIRSYVISHFRKHQASADPLDWVNVDIQLFTAHIRPTAVTQSNTSSTTRPISPKKPKETTTCNNWNTEGKGCTWNTCSRLHRCANCGSNEHPAYHCKQVKKEATIKM